MLELVKFSCGCIGTVPKNGSNIIFCDCRSEDDLNLLFESTNCANKTYSPLTYDEVRYIINSINQSMVDSNKWRKFKRLIVD